MLRRAASVRARVLGRPPARWALVTSHPLRLQKARYKPASRGPKRPGSGEQGSGPSEPQSGRRAGNKFNLIDGGGRLQLTAPIAPPTQRNPNSLKPGDGVFGFAEIPGQQSRAGQVQCVSNVRKPTDDSTANLEDTRDEN